MSANPNPVPPVQNALVPVASTEKLPDFLRTKQGDVRGGIGIKAADLILPRWVVMQPGSPLVTERKANAGDLVHTTTQSVVVPAKDRDYGNIVDVVPILCKKEFVHWHPRATKKGVKGRASDEKNPIAVAARKQLEEVRNGKKITDNEESYNETHSWVFCQVDSCEPFVVAFSKGTIRESRALLSSIAAKGVPYFATKQHMYSRLTRDKANKYPPFWTIDAKFAGFANEESFGVYEKLYERLKDIEFSYDMSAEAADTDHPGAAETSSEVS